IFVDVARRRRGWSCRWARVPILRSIGNLAPILGRARFAAWKLQVKAKRNVGNLLTAARARATLQRMTTTDPLWKGRIEGAPDPAFFAFQRSLPYDARLLPQDLQVNAAWARALGRAGLLPKDEVEQLETALA